MADETDYELLREDVGATVAQLPDLKAETLFTRAEAKYGAAADAVFAYTRVLALRSSWAKSAEEDVDYTQNEESEKLGQRPANKQNLLKYWQKELEKAIAAAANGQSTQRRQSFTVRVLPGW